MYRMIENRIQRFFEKIPNQALMITGARQVGKTYVIRKYAREHFEYVVEINFIENRDAIRLFENAKSSDDILLRISTLTDVPLEKGIHCRAFLRAFPVLALS